MYFDITGFELLDGYKINLTFEDGKSGIADLKNYVEKGGVFSKFADKNYFAQVILDKELRTLFWPDGVDIAPETLYSLATGEPLPSWVKPESNEREAA